MGMTKQEIAKSLGVSLNALSTWADKFTDWLDVDSRYINKIHDEQDYTIFRIIHEVDAQISDDYSFIERMATIERGLLSSTISKSIFQNRRGERMKPEITRWSLISVSGVSFRRGYEWLVPLSSRVDSIANFGCWATEDDICSESFALLWTLKANQIVVFEKNLEYINNATKWLKNNRSNLSLEANRMILIEGDMRDCGIAMRYAGEFELAFCHNVLYYMEDNPNEVRAAVNTMMQVVKPGGWLIVIDQKFDVEYEETSTIRGLPYKIVINNPTDISYLFESDGWEKVDLLNAPDWSYCYQKKMKTS